MRPIKLLAPLLLTVMAACGGNDGATTTQPSPGATSTPAVTTSSPTPTAATTTTVPATTTAAPTTTEPPVHQAVTITTEDGLSLEARLYPGSTEWVVLGHMFPASMVAWYGLAEVLHDAGYSVLTYNNRGYGASDGDRQPFSLGIDGDAAVDFALEGGATAIVYGGASMNGVTAMYLAANRDLSGLFTLSGVSQIQSLGGVDNYLPSITEPRLFVAARDDGIAEQDAIRYYESSSEPRRLLIYDRGGHGTDMLFTNPALSEDLLQWVSDVMPG